MKYMLLIYQDERIFGAQKQGPALEGLVARHMAFSRELGAVRVAGAGLKGTAAATTVRTSNGAQAVHDGPFAEVKEQLGGYYLIDVTDLDAAIAVARKVPLLEDGAVEIRPLIGEALLGET
jgi:hypothetical protein